MNQDILPDKCPKKVGLYFGSFNPIHAGHLNLAEYLVANNTVDEVWFVVSPNNPLKNRSELLDHHLRLEMVKISIQPEQQFRASDIEFSMPTPSYTVDTLRRLHALYPEICFSLVIGSDNALVFDKWKDYQQILEEYPVLVYPRRGYDFKQVEEKFPQMQLLNTPLYDISSTGIREKVKSNQDYSEYVTPQVRDFIDKNNLYK